MPCDGTHKILKGMSPEQRLRALWLVLREWHRRGRGSGQVERKKARVYRRRKSA